jgi:hypothetical protein
MTRVFKFIGSPGAFLCLLQLCSCTTGAAGGHHFPALSPRMRMQAVEGPCS